MKCTTAPDFGDGQMAFFAQVKSGSLSAPKCTSDGLNAPKDVGFSLIGHGEAPVWARHGAKNKGPGERWFALIPTHPRSLGAYTRWTITVTSAISAKTRARHFP